MRTFVAIDISDAARQAVAEMVSQLHAMGNSVRWVRPESLHLTLKFLGEVPEERAPELIRALEESISGIGPFEYRLTGKGCFPNCRRPRVLWVGVENPGREIFHLQERVEDAFGKIGFSRERRPFTAHLTVGRVKRPGGLEELVRAFRDYTLEPLSVFVGEVRLMRSTLKPGGAVYSVISAAKLAGNG